MKILCYQTLNISQDMDLHVLVDTGLIIGQIAGYSGQTYLLIKCIELWRDQIGLIVVALYVLLRVDSHYF